MTDKENIRLLKQKPGVRVSDAVYITGGNSYDFHRTTDGIPHLSPHVKEKIEKYSSTPLPAPLLVFRTN